MTEWWDLLGVPLIQNMFIAGLLASLVCGAVGSLVVVKRIVFASGGIAHTTFGGVGFAYWLQSQFALAWFDPLLGALFFAGSAAAIMALPGLRRTVREDSTIGVLWVAGMALGVLFLHYVDRSKVVVVDPESILFGNILLVDDASLYVIAALTALVLITVTLLYRDLHMLTFDEEFAEISGVRIHALNLILYLLVAVTTVVLINVVGIIMVLAMLTIPATMAGIWSRNLSSMMVWATLLCVIMTVAGLTASLAFDLPPGAPIVLIMTGVLLMVMVGRHVLSRTG